MEGRCATPWGGPGDLGLPEVRFIGVAVSPACSGAEGARGNAGVDPSGAGVSLNPWLLRKHCPLHHGAHGQRQHLRLQKRRRAAPKASTSVLSTTASITCPRQRGSCQL